MSFKNVECPVEIKDPYGTFANSVRISADGAEALLDFCVYSEDQNSAQVVCRVRVSRDFLLTLRSKIEDSLIGEDGKPSLLFLLPPGDA